MGRGGVRRGAGRPRWHLRTEECRQIDVRHWHRQGALLPGTAWIDGDRLPLVEFRVEQEEVNLTYSLLSGEPPVHQHVLLDRTPCHYGGERPWFLCPACLRRVAIVFLRRGGFACRRCQELVYASQSEDEFASAWRRQRKVEAKLDPHWDKPRGMHQATHTKLVSVIRGCEEQRNRALVVAHARLFGLSRPAG